MLCTGASGSFDVRQDDDDGGDGDDVFAQADAKTSPAYIVVIIVCLPPSTPATLLLAVCVSILYVEFPEFFFTSNNMIVNINTLASYLSQMIQKLQ